MRIHGLSFLFLPLPATQTFVVNSRQQTKGKLGTQPVSKLVTYFGIMLLCAGCAGQTTTPVEGVVLLDGKPLVGATVQFVQIGRAHV